MRNSISSMASFSLPGFFGQSNFFFAQWQRPFFPSFQELPSFLQQCRFLQVPFKPPFPNISQAFFLASFPHLEKGGRGGSGKKTSSQVNSVLPELSRTYVHLLLPFYLEDDNGKYEMKHFLSFALFYLDESPPLFPSPPSPAEQFTPRSPYSEKRARAERGKEILLFRYLQACSRGGEGFKGNPTRVHAVGRKWEDEKEKKKSHLSPSPFLFSPPCP